jgi:hypothetical protein
MRYSIPQVYTETYTGRHPSPDTQLQLLTPSEKGVEPDRARKSESEWLDLAR